MATPKITQLKSSPIPPLSQSRQTTLACESFYAAKHIHKMPDFESEPARRGTEIHAAIADYVGHLVRTNQQTDMDFMRSMCSHASQEEARGILERFCEDFIFNPDAVLATEFRILLDEKFQLLADVARDRQGNTFAVAGSAPRNFIDGDDFPAYDGTLDLVTMESETEATIWDWKSYFQIVDADTFQSKLYPLLLFSLNPALEKVRFVLFFVRYGASRDVTYTRAEVPKLQDLARRERDRQMSLHANYARGVELKTAPGRHCTFCPLLSDGCPMSKVNPYLKLDPAKRLMQTVWLGEAYEHSLAILKDFVVESGPIQCRDDNGGLLSAEFRPKTTKKYTLGASLPILTDWAKDHPGDNAMIEGLNVSGLSSPLKAKKRAELAEKMVKIADVRSQTNFQVGTAKEDSEGE